MFKLSYVVHENIKTISNSLNNINLSNLIGENHNVSIIMQFMYYKLKQVGYNLTPLKIEYQIYNINDILNEFKFKGISVLNHALLNDFKLNSQCYEPNLNNIYYFLNKGEILLGGIILNEKFLSNVLKIDTFKISNISDIIMSDIILIVGYNSENIYIKTKWCKKNIKIKNEYLNNIKEIWNIEIKTFY